MSDSGIVTGKAFGSATVTASAADQSVKWTVTVSKLKLATKDGKSKKLSIYSKHVKGWKKGSWKSSKPKVVKVSKGKLKALKKGSSRLTFKVKKTSWQLDVKVACAHKWRKDAKLAAKYKKLDKKYKNKSDAEREKADDLNDRARIYDARAELYNARGYMYYGEALSCQRQALACLKKANKHTALAASYLAQSNKYYDLSTKAYRCAKCGATKK